MTVETEMMNEENGRLRRHIKTLEVELRGVSDAQAQPSVAGHAAHTTGESSGHPTMQDAIDALQTKCAMQKGLIDGTLSVNRDMALEIERLTKCLEKANSQTEDFERRWYLATDKSDSQPAAMRLALSMLHFMNDNGYRLEEYEQGRMDAAIAALEELLA